MLTLLIEWGDFGIYEAIPESCHAVPCLWRLRGGSDYPSDFSRPVWASKVLKETMA